MNKDFTIGLGSASITFTAEEIKSDSMHKSTTIKDAYFKSKLIPKVINRFDNDFEGCDALAKMTLGEFKELFNKWDKHSEEYKEKYEFTRDPYWKYMGGLDTELRPYILLLLECAVD